MTLSKYCYKKGMTLEEYERLKSNIDTITDAIIQQIPQSKKDNGMYYPISDILKVDPNHTELIPFFIQSLKRKGMEFYNNDKLWRI